MVSQAVSPSKTRLAARLGMSGGTRPKPGSRERRLDDGTEGNEALKKSSVTSSCSLSNEKHVGSLTVSFYMKTNGQAELSS